MTPEFEHEFDLLMMDEGRYSNDPNDPGGETKWGFARKFNMDIQEDEWKTWTKEKAKVRAFEKWWKPFRIQEIQAPRIRHQVFNMGFVCGMKPIIKCLQVALNKLSVQVEVDGKVGPQTIMAVNSYRNQMALDAMLESEIAQYLATRPNHTRYIAGWLARNDRDEA